MNGDYISSLYTVVYADYLVDHEIILPTEGPFTVFAPNNAAFQKLPPGKLSDLLSNETALVGECLKLLFLINSFAGD
jgi:uncharacterized surface protein with fasciclin (FAS1) repeats